MKKALLELLTALLLAPLVTLHAADPVWKLTLDENFDGPELNPKIWNVETGKRRDALNSPLAVDLKDGKLVITTFTDEKGVTFDQPGIYRIRGLYAALDGSRIDPFTSQSRGAGPSWMPQILLSFLAR